MARRRASCCASSLHRDRSLGGRRLSDPIGQYVPNLLATIVASTRQTVRERECFHPVSSFESKVNGNVGNSRRFRDALSRPGRMNVVAECKKRSPSLGILSASYRPEEIAES